MFATPAGKALWDEGTPYMVPSVGNAGGPVFVYNPSKVPNPPKTAAELLACGAGFDAADSVGSGVQD